MSTKNRKRQVIMITKRSKTSHDKKNTNKKRRMLTKTKTTMNPTIIKKTKNTKPVDGKSLEKKKFVRKERNRINARRFRERRKVYVDTLEKETKTLKEENTNLSGELEKVKKQNLELLALIEELKNNTSTENTVELQISASKTLPELESTPRTEEKEQEQEQEQKHETISEKEEGEGVLSSNDIYEIESPLPSDNLYEDLEVNLKSTFQDFNRSEMFDNDFDFPTEQQYIYDEQNEKQSSQWLNFNENSSFEQNVFDSQF
ncbi:cyclic-amp response element binding protein [Anaeramoeba flamelloides]|uniref:Cyclic-amp response element binding protein n=1 Tax=Anaeramoeba flamelloides TaxID=1746091 RepID=A0AAV8A7B1_9EUKA|nr:cyclic-amp response element binding protein [Anaeramoeba flamelloides]